MGVVHDKFSFLLDFDPSFTHGKELSESNEAADLGLTHFGQNTRLGPSSTHKLAVICSNRLNL